MCSYYQQLVKRVFHWVCSRRIVSQVCQTCITERILFGNVGWRSRMQRRGPSGSSDGYYQSYLPNRTNNPKIVGPDMTRLYFLQSKTFIFYIISSVPTWFISYIGIYSVSIYFICKLTPVEFEGGCGWLSTPIPILHCQSPALSSLAVSRFW